MKHDATTLRTKKALAESLKNLMQSKPFSKITVSEITRDCGVNRKTFYYHFEDVYDLLKWMLEQEAIEVFKQFDLLVDYRDALAFVMDYVDQNKHILNCAVDSVGRTELKRFFYQDFIGIAHMMVDGAEREGGTHTSEDFRQFLCELFTEALAGVLIESFRPGKKWDRDKALNYITTILRSSILAALREAEKQGL